jgi:tyrosyl-tRNA synthetase
MNPTEPSRSPEMQSMPESVREALALAKRGAEELLIELEFAHKLQRSEKERRPLRVKLGCDPTAPDLHLGHVVVLNKLRQLQDLGHQVVFVIGDFTSMIGDPSGRNETRPPLTRVQIDSNAQSYFAQCGLVLDQSRTEIRYNSEWSDPLGARGMIELAARYTVARILERDDFTKRFRAGTPISVHELLYPLMQGYDSVALKADLELGGTDQKFNLLVGRELQKSYGQEQQCILTMPLLVGLDGVEKMSKSKGNYVGLTEKPDQMFGKLMRISDPMMWRYYELLSARTAEEIRTLHDAVEAGQNPREAKVMLAQEIVTRFHDRRAAEAALEDFETRARGGIPEEIPEVRLEGAPLGIGQLLREAGLVSSASEGLRSVDQAGVRIDGVTISDRGLKLERGTYVVQVGKRKFARVVVA